MLDRDRLYEVFQKALKEAQDAATACHRITPRAVAVRAHRIFCSELPPEEKRPALMTFCMFVAGKSALPEIARLLRDANVRPAAHSRLDRQKLRSVFQEAIQRLEARLLKGQAKPLQIARRAYEIYTRGEPSKPSRSTFQRLIYGKNADPEIFSLIQEAMAKPRKDAS